MSRERQAFLNALGMDEETESVVLGGPALARSIVDASISLRCLRTREAHRLAVISGYQGWSARVPLPTLIGREASGRVARPWSLRMISRDGSATTVHVGPEGRERFPLTAGSASGTVELRIAAASRAILWARPGGS